MLIVFICQMYLIIISCYKFKTSFHCFLWGGSLSAIEWRYGNWNVRTMLWATWSCWAITEASFNYLFFLCLFFKCMMMKSRYKQRKNIACVLMMFVRIRLATNLIGYHLKRYDVAWRARKIHFKLPIWFLLMWVASTWYKEL